MVGSLLSLFRQKNYFRNCLESQCNCYYSPRIRPDMALKSIRLAQEKQSEKKIKNKARTTAIIVLILLLLLLLLPFISGSLQVEQHFEKAILVQFDEEEFQQSASEERSSARAADNAATANEDPQPEETPATPEPVEVETPPEPQKVTPPTPDPVPIKPTVERPILTAPEPAEINIEEMLQDVPEEAQVETVSEEMVEVTEGVSDDFMKELADYFKKTDSKPSSSSGSSSSGSGSANTDKPDGGTSSTTGDGDAGKSDQGDSKTDGQGNSGTSGMDFDGDGLLTRKVIYRANIDGLIKQNGKIVVNLCVNQDGKVIFSKVDKKSSTIRDPYLLKKGERTASKYRYEKDYTVAERQCGKLTFIVKIEK